MGTFTEPEDKMNQNDQQGIGSLEELITEEDQVEPEYESLNTALDQISNCLDALERQNDQLKAQFLELLESNRATRREMQQMMLEDEECSMEGAI